MSSYTLNELSGLKAESFTLRGLPGKVLNVQAVKTLNEEILIRLLKAGANVSGTDMYGDTPLHVAAGNNNIMAAEILIRDGAKIMPKNTAGKTPLDFAESAAMIKLLKDHGAVEQ